MEEFNQLIQSNIVIALAVLAVSFAILAKSASIFVDGSVAIANKLKIPKLIIGIFLVSLATTAPELSVSLTAAIRGMPEMALGNAIGSVICDDGLAMALAGILAISPILIIPQVLRSAGIFLIIVQILLFLFIIGDNTLQRWEGAVLVGLFFAYTIMHYIQHKKGHYVGDIDLEAIEKTKGESTLKAVTYFAIGVTGIIIAGSVIVTSATTVARAIGIPEAVIALTLVALGTSIPEIATCISAARKGEGALAVGNILGADIMNICWIAGASAIANDLVLESRDIYFMFPWMFVIVGAMLFMMWRGFSMTRKKGMVLLFLYMLYIASFFIIYRPGAA